LETIATGLGRSPFSIRQGDHLRSKDLTQSSKTKVISVAPPNSAGKVRITTEEGEHLFEPHQPVAFPRRANGQTKVHWERNPHLGEVVIGDVVPPPTGWPGNIPDIESGRLVSDIQVSKRYGGFIVSYRHVNGEPGGKMFVPIDSVFLYTGAWTDLLSRLESDGPRYRPEPKNASGIYEHLESGEQARFKIAGKRGRTPQGNILEAPSSNIADWEQWLLISGNRHPSDPRK
jgi:hypothetical protein